MGTTSAENSSSLEYSSLRREKTTSGQAALFLYRETFGKQAVNLAVLRNPKVYSGGCSTRLEEPIECLRMRA